MQSKSGNNANDFNFIVVYLLEWLTGLIYFLVKGGQDKRIKQHSMQAIILGVVSVVISFLGFIPFIWVLSVLIWVYGMYIGYEASLNNDIPIPIITDFVKQYV